MNINEPIYQVCFVMRLGPDIYTCSAHTRTNTNTHGDWHPVLHDKKWFLIINKAWTTMATLRSQVALTTFLHVARGERDTTNTYSSSVEVTIVAHNTYRSSHTKYFDNDRWLNYIPFFKKLSPI